MLGALARFAVRYRWLVLFAWVLLLVGAGAILKNADEGFVNDLTLSDTDSQAAYDTLREQFPDMSGDGMQVVLHSPDGVSSPQVRSAVEAALATVTASDDVAAVQSPYGPPAPMISEDEQTAVATVRFAEQAKDIPEDAVTDAQQAFEPVRDLGVQVEFGGPAVETETGPSGSEVIGLAAAVVVLLIAFGSLLAMAVPLVTAVAALAVGMSAIYLISEWVSIGTAGPVVAAMIGLGVGIDYALLIVTRHREGLHAGQPVGDSVARALSTAGRAVVVAGLTVIVAILSLYLIGIPFVSTLGLASAIAVGATLLAAMTLLPAILGIFGRHLDRFRVRRIHDGNSDNTRWHRWVRHVQRFPKSYVLVSIIILGVLAVPLFSLRLGTADGGSQPPDSSARKAYDLVAENFGPGWTGPLLVTAEFDTGSSIEAQQAAGSLREDLAAVPGVAQVAPPRLDPTGQTAVFTVVPTSSPDDEATEDLVHRLRDDVLAADSAVEAHVGGATATSIDLADKLGERMGWFMGLVVALGFLLLLFEFRSLLVPLMAVSMNLLAVGAAYGPVVAVFQWGWLSDVLGSQPGPVESFAPVMLFAVLFGLSTDYAVFLLSRIKEAYYANGDARQAVVEGVARTGRVIAAAASVMVVVFASFMLNDQRVVNMFGFGLAMAIAVYAAVVTMVLVPALLTMAGRRAWALPRWLDRVLPGKQEIPQLTPAPTPVLVPAGDLEAAGNPDSTDDLDSVGHVNRSDDPALRGSREPAGLHWDVRDPSVRNEIEASDEAAEHSDKHSDDGLTGARHARTAEQQLSSGNGARVGMVVTERDEPTVSQVAEVTRTRWYPDLDQALQHVRAADELGLDVRLENRRNGEAATAAGNGGERRAWRLTLRIEESTDR